MSLLGLHSRVESARLVICSMGLICVGSGLSNFHMFGVFALCGTIEAI